MANVKNSLDSILALFRAGKLLEAKELCSEMLGRYPNNAGILLLLGVIYHGLGEYDAAIQNLEKSAQIDPTSDEIYYSLGNIYQDTQQHDLAVACYKKALQLNPHQAITYYSLGFSMQCKGQIDEAIAYYQKALRLNLQTFSLYNNLGVALQAKNNIDEAMTCYQNALRLNASSPEAHNNLGIVSQIKGRLDEAAAYYQKAIQLKQDYADAYCNLGTVFREKGKFDEAIPYFHKAITINKDFAWAHTNLGFALDNKGHIDEAKRHFRKAFHNISKTSHHHVHFVRVLDSATIRGGTADPALRSNTKSLLIYVCAFNRKKITHLSLAQMQRYKTPACRLQVYNDHSTEYDNEFLAPYADEVIKLPGKLGVNKLRWHQFRMFLDSDFDLLYMTDNDVIHDPHFVSILTRLYEMGEGKLPVTIYNNIYTLRPHMIVAYKNELILKTTAPGASMLYDKAMVRKILDTSHTIGSALDYLPWDNRAVVCLGLPWISPETSYLEHYGAQGMNNDNYDQDRAVFPTQYLRDRREAILSYLANDSPLTIPL